MNPKINYLWTYYNAISREINSGRSQIEFIHKIYICLHFNLTNDRIGLEILSCSVHNTPTFHFLWPPRCISRLDRNVEIYKI